MILDASKMTNEEQAEFREGRKRIYVDGVEVHKVHYLDTDKGVLQTYDVFREGLSGPVAYHVMKAPGEMYKAADFPGREVECEPDSVLIETLRGKVEIRET